MGPHLVTLLPFKWIGTASVTCTVDTMSIECRLGSSIWDVHSGPPIAKDYHTPKQPAVAALLRGGCARGTWPGKDAIASWQPPGAWACPPGNRRTTAVLFSPPRTAAGLAQGGRPSGMASTSHPAGQAQGRTSQFAYCCFTGLLGSLLAFAVFRSFIYRGLSNLSSKFHKKTRKMPPKPATAVGG